jgi:hypothetical protein
MPRSHQKCLIIAVTFVIAACSKTPELVRLEGAGNDLFCATLEDIRKAPSLSAPLQNELVGHAANIESLYEAAPKNIAEDLRSIHEILAASRDSKGTDTLLAFQMLTDPKLAGYEGRVAELAKETCGISDGDTTYFVDPEVRPPSLCRGWPSTGSPLTNDRFPYLLDTSSANYFSNIFFSGPKSRMRDGMIYVPRGGKVTFKGEYPHAGYFGFNPNDMATNNLQTLMDVDIDPNEGSINPWREPMPSGMGRDYTAHLVIDKNPETPAPNTSYVGQTKSGGKNYATFQIYRVYGAELPSLPPNSAGVLLPSVTVYDKKGTQIEHHPKCDPYPDGYKPPVDETKFPAFPVPDHRAQSHAGTFNVKGNFGLDIDLLSNADVLYISSYYGRPYGEVFAIRAKKPKTVNKTEGREPWSDDLDFRMWTACTYNFWNGKANDCVVDNDILADEDGYYTLLVSEPKNRPANATNENHITWLDAGNFLDGQISFRMLPKTTPFLEQLRKDVQNSTLSPYRPETAFCHRETFERGGFAACRLESTKTK